MAHDPPVNSTHLRSLAFLETAGAIERLEDGTSSTFPVSSAAKTVLDRPTVGAMLSTLGGASLDAPLFPEGISVDGNLQFNSGYGSVATAYGCRAWVNFDGTGTVEIRASGNVSSITDNGVGIYSVNFINPMPDANYSVVNALNNTSNNWLSQARLSALNISNCTIFCLKGGVDTSGHTAYEPTICCLAFFR